MAFNKTVRVSKARESSEAGSCPSQCEQSRPGLGDLSMLTALSAYLTSSDVNAYFIPLSSVVRTDEHALSETIFIPDGPQNIEERLGTSAQTNETNDRKP